MVVVQLEAVPVRALTRLVCCLLAWTAIVPVSQGQIVSPKLNTASPCAVQTGSAAECVFAADDGHIGAYQVLVSGRGVTGEVVSPAPITQGAASGDAKRTSSSIKVRLTAVADAPLGIRDVRLLTPRGPSTLGQIVIVADRIIREVNPNNTMKEAQAVTLPASLSGVIENKVDVDFYKFEVRAGAAVTFHMYCQRLQNKLTPFSFHTAPMITLRNATGAVLATNDYFFGGDPLIHYRFATGGEYYLEVRDVRYEGYHQWEYVVEANERPFVAAVSPACLPPGVPTKVRLIGYNLPADPFVTVTLPKDAPAWELSQPLPDLAGQPLHSVPVQASPLPQVLETTGRHDTPKEAQALSLPAAVGGVIERPGNVDCYAFQAKKGERFTFRIIARSLNSELDSVLRILDAKEEILAENDDASDRTGHPESRNEILCADSRIENWSAPADGRYILEVSDTQGRGGPRFTYSLLARASQPSFELELTTDRTVLAPGARGVIFVRSIRKDGFTGDIQLAIENLPPGVTAVCGKIPGPCQDGCILLSADSARPRAFSSIRVLGIARIPDAGKGAEKEIIVAARPYAELMRDGGARYLVPVHDHVVGTVDQLDIKAVRFSPSEIKLKPGETKPIKVTIERRPGFDDAVTLSVKSGQHVWIYGNCLPQGVTLDDSSLIRLSGNNLTGTLVLRAAANAKPVERQLVPIMAEVSINFPLRMYYAGEPFWLSVEGQMGK